MKIYAAEEKIKDVISASLSSSLVARFNHSDEQVDLFKKSVASLETEEKIKTDLSKIVDQPHPDLLYGSAILVSANMNLNDDIFLQEETWAARNTPVATPYNVDHESTDIIGHIISSRPVNDNGETLETVPENDIFHLEVGFVMYKFIFPELAQSIISKAESGNQSVSMECILEDFDYGIIDNEGNLSVIARNEETAFLTKKLRIYGGTGDYQGYKIGRVLRNLRFVGMGSVSVPANPNSKYLQFLVSAKNKFNLYKDLEELNKTKAFLYKDERGKVMTIKTLEEAQAFIEKLEQKIAEAETSVSEANTKAESADEKVKALEAEKQELETSVADLNAKLEAESVKTEAAEQKVEETKASLKETTDKYDELEKSHTEATEKLEQIEKEKTLASRVAKLQELRVKDIDSEKIGNMTDEVFASTIEFIESMEVESVEAEKKDEDMKDEDKKKKDEEAKKKDKDYESKASETIESLEDTKDEDNKEALAHVESDEDKDAEDENPLAALASLLTATQNPNRGILNK